MGGGRETKKSLEEVKDDLAKKLTDNARALLKSDFGITDDTSNLETLLHKLAVNRFRRVYGYEFKEDASKMNPPNDPKDPRSTAKLCSIVPPIGNQINDYLKAGVFSGLNLPEWMEQTAFNDLSNIANIIAARDTKKQWEYNEYRRTYDARIEDQDSYICNSVMVYCNGNLVEDGSRAELAIIYYVGVHYKTNSETKVTRDEIQTSAYAGAQQQLNGAEIPTTDKKLQDILDTYAKDKFQTEFGHAYGGDPPDSYRARQGVASAFVTQNSKLYYIPDIKTDNLANFIEHQVYSGINIPLKSVRNNAIKDTIAQYQSILKNESTGSWNMTRLDETYIPADPTNNPIRQTGLIMSWYDHKTTDTQVSISVTYIYIITMFYECPNAEQELAGELFKVLCNNLRRHISGKQGLSDIADLEALKQFLKEYAVQEFKKVFGFDYKGENSKPPNLRKGGKVDAHAELLNLKSYPVQQMEVESWMDNEVFRKDSGDFPAFALGRAYDDIVSHMMYYGSHQTPKENNFWYTGEFKSKYTNKKKKRGIQQFAFYLYALGDMTLNKVDRSGQEGVHIKQLYVYYLGVFSSYDPAANAW